MARGGGRRTYVRDNRGRFSSTPGGGSGRPGAKRVSRGTNRLTRDNAGRITSAGGSGATARGGRLKTASGNLRATQTASAKAAGFRSGVIAKGGRGVSGSVARSLAAVRKAKGPQGGRVPAAQRPGSLTSTLRGTLQALAKTDAARIREIEAITGQPVRAPRKPAAGTGATVRAPGRGSVTGTLGDNLRRLAQSDARTAREMADLSRSASKGALRGSGGGKPKQVRGAQPKPKARSLAVQAAKEAPKSKPGKPIGGERQRTRTRAVLGSGQMKPPMTLARMQQAGGNRWQKNNMDRVYFNDLTTRSKLKVDTYKSGNISSASLRGSPISNAKATEISAFLSASKVFYDRKTRKMVTQEPSIAYGRPKQVRTGKDLLKSVEKSITRQSRMRPTLRANQRRRRPS